MSLAASPLQLYTDSLVRHLPGWCDHRLTSTGFTSSAASVGELRSRRMAARGVEKGEPRSFELDDDFNDIDFGRLPPSANDDLIRAVLRGELRLVPAIRVIESELILVVDLSRSMLAGFVDTRTEISGREADRTLRSTLHPGDTAKLRALFFTVAAYAHLGAGLGFKLRVLYIYGAQVVFEKLRGSIGQLLVVILNRMRGILLLAHKTLMAPNPKDEPFMLRVALGNARSVGVRSVVLVVSDFLDPFSDYRAALIGAAARHHVILADVAGPSDREVTVRRFYQTEAARPFREFGRHLERDARPHSLPSRELVAWNRDRQADLAALEALRRRAGAEYVRQTPTTPRPAAVEFRRCYLRAHEQLRRLR